MMLSVILLLRYNRSLCGVVVELLGFEFKPGLFSLSDKN